jgi:hypothetical protein
MGESGYVSDDFDPVSFSLLKQAMAALEAEGMLEVVGIGDDGEEMYQITEKGFAYYMGNQMDFDTWAKVGYQNGWCSPPVCYSHDGVPMTATEIEELDTGEEPCLHVIRLYESMDQKKGCEAQNPAAVWRATNQGWDE